jgi:DNA-binding transcriptional ArsR family regulator
LPATKKETQTLEAQVADLRDRMAWLEAQVKEAQADREDDLSAAPARSVRRATQRRASRRRAEARTRKIDAKTSILEFLATHPGSTAGEVAKALDLERTSVSSTLAQLVRLGQIRKAERGYAAA